MSEKLLEARRTGIKITLPFGVETDWRHSTELIQLKCGAFIALT